METFGNFAEKLQRFFSFLLSVRFMMICNLQYFFFSGSFIHRIWKPKFKSSDFFFLKNSKIVEFYILRSFCKNAEFSTEFPKNRVCVFGSSDPPSLLEIYLIVFYKLVPVKSIRLITQNLGISNISISFCCL